jgi:flagellar basal-body rod protein FlgB
MALQAAMNGSMLRQTLLTSDLANANTPNFQPQDVNFQQQLAQQMGAGTPADDVTFTPTTASQTNGPDGNGVDSELTNAEISENGLLYQELTEVAAAREQILKTALNATS